MTFPFSGFDNLDDREEIFQLQPTDGGFGGGGGGAPPSPISTPTPTPTIEQTNPQDECSILIPNSCPNGQICAIVTTGTGAFGIPQFAAQCITPATPTPTPTPTRRVTGGGAYCIQPGGACVFYAGVQDCADEFTEPCTPSVKCCGPGTGYTCAEIAGTTCPEGTSGCDSLGESCAPPVTPRCNYVEDEFPCGRISGFDGYTGTARITSISRNANGNALPLGCVEDPNVDTRLDTSECAPPNPPSCVYKSDTATCNAVKQDTGWIGTATRQIIDQALSESNCVQDANLGTAGPWDVSDCERQPPLCDTIVETSNCQAQLGELYRASEILTKTTIRTVNGVNQPRGCNAAETATSNYDTSICTPPPGVCETETQTTTCRAQLGINYSPTQTLSRTVVRIVNGQTVPRNCITDGLILSEYDTSICDPIPEEIQEIIKCTPPTVTTRTVNVACTAINRNIYSGGTAQQRQVANYDASVEGPGTCPFTWQNSGEPDTSGCQLINIPQVTQTPRIPQVPQTCRAPNLPASRTVPVECSQIDRKYTRGQAIQRQVLRVDTTQPGPAECPYVWENSGTPDVSSCIIPVFWRNCVTGQLIEGNPPTDFQQSEFLGAGGGTCWEPIADLGFEPSLNEALRYSYQRGSSKYPTGRDIKVTNPSYGTSYKVTITTNSNITLSNRTRTGNKGTLSFTVAPRASEMFTVNITPQLLQELQDGLSTLSMAVEYQKVIT